MAEGLIIFSAKIANTTLKRTYSYTLCGLVLAVMNECLTHRHCYIRCLSMELAQQALRLFVFCHMGHQCKLSVQKNCTKAIKLCKHFNNSAKNDLI